MAFCTAADILIFDTDNAGRDPTKEQLFYTIACDVLLTLNVRSMAVTAAINIMLDKKTLLRVNKTVLQKFLWPLYDSCSEANIQIYNIALYQII